MKEGPAWFFSLLLFSLWPCSPSCFFALSAFYPCDFVPPALLQSLSLTSARLTGISCLPGSMYRSWFSFQL